MRRILMMSVLLSALGLGVPAAGQEGPGGSINPNRDCQTLLTCRYAKGGSYRGCVSSYSCRRCTFVTARCAIPGRGRKVCQELRCGWGA